MISAIANRYKAAYSGLPREVWMLTFVLLVNRSGSMVIFFMTLYLTQSLNHSIIEAGQILSSYGIGALLGAYLGGWLTDLWGTKTVQMLTLILAGVLFVILGYVESIIPIAVLLFLIAVMAEGFRPASLAAVAEYVPPALRPRSYAMLRLASNLGVVIGPAVGGLLATVGYVYLFWADGLTCLFAAGLFWIFFHGKKPKSHVESSKIVAAVDSPWRDKIFIITLLTVFPLGLVFTQVLNTWPIYFKEVYHLVESEIGTLLGLNGALIVLVEMPIIHWLETKNVLRIMSIGALIFYAGFAMLPLGSTYLYAIITVIIWSIGEVMVFPLISSFVANRSAESNRGKYMGMLTFAFSLPLVVGPVVGTWIYHTLGPDNLWYLLGASGLLVFFGFEIVNKMVKKEKSSMA